MSKPGTVPSLSVVVPTFNEAENLPVLITALQRVLASREYEIIVVDDNSPDGTWRIAEEMSNDDARIRVVRRLDETGLSSAILHGMQEARGDVLAVGLGR